MSLFHLPAGITNRIEKFQHDFLWGELDKESKYHLESWSKVSSQTSMGGLGVLNLLFFISIFIFLITRNLYMARPFEPILEK